MIISISTLFHAFADKPKYSTKYIRTTLELFSINNNIP